MDVTLRLETVLILSLLVSSGREHNTETTLLQQLACRKPVSGPVGRSLYRVSLSGGQFKFQRSVFLHNGEAH